MGFKRIYDSNSSINGGVDDDLWSFEILKFANFHWSYNLPQVIVDQKLEFAVVFIFELFGRKRSVAELI